MELCRLQAKDVNAARGVLVSAFSGDPYVAWSAAGRETTVVPTSFELSIRAQLGYGGCFGMRVGQELAGVALFQPPAVALGYGELERAGLWGLIRASGFVSATRFLRSFLVLERFKSKLLIGEPHLYLDTVGVHHDHAARGIGKHLVRAALDALAPAYPLPCLVLTHMEHNLPFYRGLGFEPLAHYRFDPARLTFHALVRPAAASSAQVEPDAV